MALMDKIFGEFVDVIEWTDDTQGHGLPLGGTATRSSTAPADPVRETQAAVLVNEGRSPTFPACTSCDAKCRSSRPCRTGSARARSRPRSTSSPSVPDLKWGTKTRSSRAPRVRPVRLRAFGTEIRIVDPAIPREIVGTDALPERDHRSLRNLMLALCHRGRELGHSDPRPRRHYEQLGQFVPAIAEFANWPRLASSGRERVAAARGRAGADRHLDGRGRRSEVHPVPGRRGDARGRENPGGDAGAGVGMGMGMAMARQIGEAIAGEAAAPGDPPPLPQEGRSTSPATGSRPDPIRSAS